MSSVQPLSNLQLAHRFRWRWISPILLGISANFLVNAILNFRRPIDTFQWDEYINAILGSIILLEGQRLISRKLDRHFPWSGGLLKRVLVQVSFHMVFIVFTINLLLILVHWLYYDGFYSPEELTVINSAVLVIALVFSLAETGMKFHQNWHQSLSLLKTMEQELESIESNSSKEKPIEILFGNVRHLIPVRDVICATSEARSVYICTRDDRKLFYPHSLESLSQVLNINSFYRANRQTILNIASVASTRSLAQGKIEVTLISGQSHPQSIIVSRIKAAEFRKWLKSLTS